MEKIKLFIQSEVGKDILVICIVILVGLGSFELGRLSKEGSNSGIKVNYPTRDTTQSASVISTIDNLRRVTQNANSSGKNYFASNRGKKYYSLGCSAGKTIKDDNKIYFATKDEAEKAGYLLSSSCN